MPQLRQLVHRLAHAKLEYSRPAEVELDQLLSSEQSCEVAELLASQMGDLDAEERRWLGSLLTSHDPPISAPLLLRIWGCFLKDQERRPRPRWPLTLQREQTLADDFFTEIGEVLALDWESAEFEALVPFASSTDPFERSAFADMVLFSQASDARALASPIAAALKKLLEDTHPRVQEAACYAWSKLPGSAPVPALRRAADADHERVRAAAVLALAATDAAGDLLQRSLKDDSEWVRVALLRGLQVAHNLQRLGEVLQTLRRDGSSWVRAEAAAVQLAARPA